MTWDPFGTLHKALWIGGAPWTGKSTVARLLAERHGLTTYHHDDRGDGGPVAPPAGATAADLLDETLAESRLRFRWAMEDLRALMSPRPIVAEGQGLRPDLVPPLVDSRAGMGVRVPPDLSPKHQLGHRPEEPAIPEQR